MGLTRRDSVPEILLEPAIGDLARSIEAPTRSSSRELTLGGRNASGEIVLRRTDGTVMEPRGTENTAPGLLARGSGPIGSADDVAIIHAPKVELDSTSLFSSAVPTVEIDLAELESKRVAVAAKVRANAEPEVEVVDDLLLDPWFFKTEEEIAAIEDDPTARIIEIKIAPLDTSAFDDDRWVF